MAKNYDDFDDDERDGIFNQIFSIVTERKREFAIVSVVGTALILGMILWNGSSGPDDSAGGNVPVVRADLGDYKSMPDNPGGMEVPYRDSTVFSSADTSDSAPENILADSGSSETPVSRDQMFAGLKTDQTAAQAQQQVAPVAAPAQDALAQAAPSQTDKLVSEAIGTADNGTVSPVKKVAPVVVEDAPVATAKVEPTPAPAPKVEPKTDAKVVAKEVAKAEPAAGSTAAKAVSPGTYYIQLASVKDTGRAADEYKKLQAKYTSLSSVSYRAQKADLGAKGTFYRIQAGPMSKDSAAGICSKIKAGGGSCLVVAK